jgi:hypothetical protein
MASPSITQDRTGKASIASAASDLFPAEVECCKEVDALGGCRLPQPGNLISVVLMVYKSLLSGNWMPSRKLDIQPSLFRPLRRRSVHERGQW